MIGKLRGIIDSVGDNHAIIDVAGVGYIVFCSSRTLQALGGISDEISLITETHVREDHIHLYGFMNVAEKSWFNLLTTVQGVGAKVALVILGCFSCEELTNIIAVQDKQSLTKASGVGKKLAERIAIELKNKVGSIVTSTAVEMGLPSDNKSLSIVADIDKSQVIKDEAISALVNLGYSKIDAFSITSKIIHDNPEANLSDIITQSLQEIA